MIGWACTNVMSMIFVFFDYNYNLKQFLHNTTMSWRKEYAGEAHEERDLDHNQVIETASIRWSEFIAKNWTVIVYMDTRNPVIDHESLLTWHSRLQNKDICMHSATLSLLLKFWPVYTKSAVSLMKTSIWQSNHWTPGSISWKQERISHLSLFLHKKEEETRRGQLLFRRPLLHLPVPLKLN